MATKGQTELVSTSSPTNIVRWTDTGKDKNSAVTGTDASSDDHGFLARQKRRISEYPKISQLQLARKSSKHNITFLRKAADIISSLLIFRILCAILRLIPISKIVMSAIFFKQCPAQPIIVIYLLVGGIAACVRDVASLCVSKCLDQDCKKDYEICLVLMSFFYTIAEFAWFIFGSVYVYKTYGNFQFTDSSMNNYCNQALYTYAFVVTTISYALLLMVFILSCCTVCLASYADTSTPKSRKSNISI